MISKKPVFVFFAAVYAIALYYFYLIYVPLVKPFQIALVPILLVVVALTAIHLQWGTLFFIFSFPLINNLPYFFGIYEPLPHAPTALVLSLFYFLGFFINKLFVKSRVSARCPIFKPAIIFSIVVLISAIMTFFRYTNFYPFVSDGFYELITSVYRVTAGGAVMSIVFNSLNYLTGFAFFFILFNAGKSKRFLEKALFVLLASTLISLMFGLFQHLKNMKLGNNPISVQHGLINATFKDALSFGAYIGIFAPLILGVFCAFKGMTRILSFIILMFSGYMIWFSGAKSGVLSLIISLFLFMFLSSKAIFSPRSPMHFSLKNIHWSSFVVLFLIIALVLSFVIFEGYFIKEVSTSRSFMRLKAFIPHLEQRVNTLWKMAAVMIKDYPICGVGIGGYIIEVSNYAEIYKTQVGIPESAENCFLQLGSELGMVGILLMGWIFWEIIKQMRRGYRRIPANDPQKFVFVGATVGIISFWLNSLTHSYIGSYEIIYSFWLLVGLVFLIGEPEKETKQKLHLKSRQKILALLLLILFSAALLWNSTHSLSLKSRTKLLRIRQDFGFYQLEKTSCGREFRWTREYGGLTIKIEKPVIEIPILASHPNIHRNPVKVKIYIVKDFFRQKKLLDEITLTRSVWNTYEYHIPEEVGQEVILLLKVNRTWNPLKILGTPDPRNLGVGLGKIEFKDKC